MLMHQPIAIGSPVFSAVNLLFGYLLVQYKSNSNPRKC